MIRIYCGKPGSGKSAEIRKEIKRASADADNTIMVMHGCLDTDKTIGIEGDNIVEKFGFSIEDIKRLTDASIALKKLNPNSICYLFIDHGVVFTEKNSNDLAAALIAADYAGVKTTIATQNFSSISKFAPEFFAEHCDYYIVHKEKSPRLASGEDFVKYR